jgi:protein tyrosine phosphatase
MQFDKSLPDRNLDMEYRILRRITESQFHSKNLINFDPSISKHNRYPNILPFKHTQVNLPQDPSNDQSPYINASYISTIFNNDNFFIATQAPL